MSQFPCASSPTNSAAIEVFYDGDCPLCMKEISMLMHRDRQSRISFTDIARADFDPSNVGVTQEVLMRRIHGRLPDGSLIEGVEVFRRLYAAIGFGPIVWLTRIPVVSHALDLAYSIFAKNRLRLTGRCSESCALANAPGHAGVVKR
jgi:predicted DCC family thiol-disulfide oxidoreductase YuxK